MDADILGNIYVITSEGQLKKYSASGDSLAVWNNVKSFGNPTSLDVSNPMRILLYYQPFATIVILDRLLAQRNVINLRKQNIFRVHALTNSYDNNIWLFDEQDLRIKKIDDAGSVTLEGTDWRMLFTETPSPSAIFDMHNQICLYDTARGAFCFDYYGSFKNKIPVPGLRFFGMNENLFYGVIHDELVITDASSLATERFLIKEPPLTCLDIKYRNKHVYLLTSKGIHIRKASNP